MSAKKEAGDRRTPRTISISPNEWLTLKQAAALDGRSVSDFLRHASLTHARVVLKGISTP